MCKCVDAVHDKLIQENKELGNGNPSSIKAIGITNQRETVIAWNARTGLAYHNAIVWDDLRTTDIAHDIAMEGKRHLPEGMKPTDGLRQQTGLPIASYFSGTKLRWLVRNVPRLRSDLEKDCPEREHVRFGTIDTWLVYNLTGSSHTSGHIANIGGIHITDVTNASRWLLMDIEHLQWDDNLVKAVVCGDDESLSIPISSLPEIRRLVDIHRK